MLLALVLIASCPRAADTPAQAGAGPGISDGGTAGGNSSPPAPQADPAGGRRLPLSSIQLPAGFSIAVYAADVPNARSLCLTPSGTLFVGNRSGDKVYALRDEDGDNYAEQQYVIASGLNMPNGVAFRDGDLYVAEVSRVWRLPDIEGRLADPPRPELIKGDFPSETHHGWKFIRFGPDNKLYVPVGAPCNVCERPDPYASITRMNPDGSDWEVIARGIRNTVGFDWQPGTGELWFTDNGRDNLGDDLPADELNRITAPGQHFGFPYVHQGDTLDPDYGAGHDPADYTAPAIKLGPHVAALGMRFYTGGMFPDEYRGQIFIAEHGSWNRSVPLGARVMLVRLNAANAAVSYEEFATGWQRPDGNRWGRPVDVEVMADGSLLVSDDLAGAVYRIAYSAPGD